MNPGLFSHFPSSLEQFFPFVPASLNCCCSLVDVLSFQCTYLWDVSSSLGLPYFTMLCLEMACQAGQLNERRHFSLLGTHRMPPQAKDLYLSSVLGLSGSLSPHLLLFPCSYFIPL